jgi:serine/threonine protein kinase
MASSGTSAKQFLSELHSLGLLCPEEIGNGTFSVVFHAWLLPRLAESETEPTEVAVKLLWDDVAESRLLREAMVLDHLDGRHGCVPLWGVQKLSLGSVLVMPYLETSSFETMACGPMATDDEAEPGNVGLGWGGMAVYLGALLRAIAHCHSRGVIHRDVKPRNFLFNAETGEGLLIDFGLAESSLDQLRKASRFRESAVRSASRGVQSVIASAMDRGLTRPEIEACLTLDLTDPRVVRSQRLLLESTQEAIDRRRSVRPMKASRAGTPGFRPPEVLLSVPEQGPAVDIWAVGVILASLLSRRSPLFPGRDDGKHLSMISSLVGPDRLSAVSEAWGRPLLEAPCWEEALGPPTAPRAAAAHVEDLFRRLPHSFGTTLDQPVEGVTPIESIPPRWAVYPAPDSDSFSPPTGKLSPVAQRILKDTWTLPMVSTLDNTSGADRHRVARLVPLCRVANEAEHAAALLCVDLLAGLLDPDPASRLSAAEALAHPFLTADFVRSLPHPGVATSR